VRRPQTDLFDMPSEAFGMHLQGAGPAEVCRHEHQNPQSPEVGWPGWGNRAAPEAASEFRARHGVIALPAAIAGADGRTKRQECVSRPHAREPIHRRAILSPQGDRHRTWATGALSYLLPQSLPDRCRYVPLGGAPGLLIQAGQPRGNRNTVGQYGRQVRKAGQTISTESISIRDCTA